MKMFSVLMVFLSVLFFSCSSTSSNNSDTDISANDSTSNTENEHGDSDYSGDSEYDGDDKNGDNDEGKDSGEDDIFLDDDATAEHICNPNPCEIEKNITEHRTRCMPADEGKNYTCECNVSYHTSEGLCCQAYSNNIEGQCVCNTYYVAPHDDKGRCVPECSENTIEGLNGYCEEGKVCQQGICIVDRCFDYECPESSTCSTKNDAPFCQCDDGLQMSNDKCCPINSTNKSGVCECNEGYTLSKGKCEPLITNKCFPNPCEGSGNTLHKNVCVLDESVAGYHCDCNENYEPDGAGCTLVEFEVCPTGLQCLAGYCVPFDLSNEQCLTTDDCREFPGAVSTCASPHAAGGICLGCSVASDCPGNTQCYETYSVCALMCDDDTDCPYGKCATTGYCAQKKCYSNEDCFGGSLCIDSSGSGSGMCQRIPCKETACSTTNPGGSCDDGAACIAGKCVSSCTPNPCKEINRSTCETKLGVPTCVCDAGTVEISGKCEPKTVSECPSGFTCSANVCVNKSDIGFVCSVNADCEDVDLTCSPALPSGVCSGCTYPAECPHGGAEFSDCVSGYCLRTCFLDSDCNKGMKCLGSGYCGKQDCIKVADCPTGYTCSSGGRCSRIPCS